MNFFVVKMIDDKENHGRYVLSEFQIMPRPAWRLPKNFGTFKFAWMHDRGANIVAPLHVNHAGIYGADDTVTRSSIRTGWDVPGFQNGRRRAGPIVVIFLTKISLGW